MELDGAQYLGFRLPFTISQLVWIEAILVGGAEIYRNRELDPEKRIYPGALNFLIFPGDFYILGYKGILAIIYPHTLCLPGWPASISGLTLED